MLEQREYLEILSHPCPVLWAVVWGYLVRH